jgi:hypothetical protein
MLRIINGKAAALTCSPTCFDNVQYLGVGHMEHSVAKGSRSLERSFSRFRMFSFLLFSTCRHLRESIRPGLKKCGLRRMQLWLRAETLQRKCLSRGSRLAHRAGGGLEDNPSNSSSLGDPGFCLLPNGFQGCPGSMEIGDMRVHGRWGLRPSLDLSGTIKPTTYYGTY